MEVSAREVGPTINDVLRYTMIVDDEKYARVTTQMIDALIEDGNLVYKIHNYWDSDDYRGLNMSFQKPDGILFELQFHTPDSYDAKNETHELYEIIRSDYSSDEEKTEAFEARREREMAVPVPEGALDIQYEALVE